MMYKYFLLYACLLGSCISHIHAQSQKILDIKPASTLSKYDQKELKQKKCLVYLTMSPECVITRNSTLYIRELVNVFSSEKVSIIGVFPGAFYTKSEIKTFLKKYQLGINAIIDKDYAFTHHMGAKVTPEAFVFNQAGNIKYRGAINDLYYELGKRNINPQQNYLQSAIDAVLKETEPTKNSTKAIGCLIQFDANTEKVKHH